MTKTEIDPQTRSCKYKVEQTPLGALIAVCGDAFDEVVAADYTRLRVKLESEGFRVVLEE